MTEQGYQGPVEIDAVDYRNTLYKDPKVIAEKVLKTSVSTCTLTIPLPHPSGAGVRTTTIPFYMREDFSFGLANQWTQFIGNTDNVFLDLINAVAIFSGETQVSAQSEVMATKVWKGSTFDPFSLNCVIVATNRNVNPVKILRDICSTCLPTKLTDQKHCATALQNVKSLATGLVDLGETAINSFGSENASWKTAVTKTSNQIQQAIRSVGMVAPLNYGVLLSEGVDDAGQTTFSAIHPLQNTTVSMTVGNYFRAYNLLVESISGVRISKECISPPTNYINNFTNLYNSKPVSQDYGFPLYVEFTIRLVPFSLVDKDTFNSYFVDTKDSAGTVADVINRGMSYVLP